MPRHPPKPRPPPNHEQERDPAHAVRARRLKERHDMEVTREQVKDFLKNMSLMDAATLVKELEAELGVSAAAPVAVAAAGGAPAGAAAAAAPEKEDFTVVLTGDRKSVV